MVKRYLGGFISATLPNESAANTPFVNLTNVAQLQSAGNWSLPGAPTGLSASPGNGQVSVSFTANTLSLSSALVGTSGGYGNHVIVDHGSKLTVYGHLKTILVRRGQAVKKGTIIGLSGGRKGTVGRRCPCGRHTSRIARCHRAAQSFRR